MRVEPAKHRQSPVTVSGSHAAVPAAPANSSEHPSHSHHHPVSHAKRSHHSVTAGITPSMDGVIQRECAMPFDYVDDKSFDRLYSKRPTLMNAIERVAKLTEVPLRYLLASLYKETNLKVDVGVDPIGIAQIRPLAWQDVMTNPKQQKWRDEFVAAWRQLAPGAMLPTKPGLSATADILFMAVWTRKREADCNITALFPQESPIRDLARRLSYHVHANLDMYLTDLYQTGMVWFNTPNNQGSWDDFERVLLLIDQSLKVQQKRVAVVRR